MEISEQEDAYLLLEDGLLIKGKSIGYKGTSGGEICFNTGMTGYQEIYTDPSYYGQIIINTNAHIGNYGALDEEQESDGAKISGLIVNEYSYIHSRKTATEGLQDFLERNKIVGISGIDTRKLVRHIRSKGAMNGIISSVLNPDKLESEISKVPSMDGLELSSVVSTKEIYTRGDESAPFKVAVLDLGIKKSILDNLIQRGCYCKVYPAKTPFSEIEKFNANGYFLSNGPGDPASMEYAVETVSAMLKTEIPIFGICLGHQILARACGIGTYKMHHGHRGLNHPIKNLETGLSEITSQNHGFVVSEKDVEASEMVDCTHIHLNDDTVAGLKVRGKKAFSVQYHPESSPGPHDSRYLFDTFIQNMK